MAGTIQANEVVFALVKQAAEDSGVPETPEFDILRRTSGNISQTFNFTQSNEVDATRQGAEQIKIGQPVEGSLDGEMPIADPIMHTLIEGAIQGEFSTPINFSGDTVAFDEDGSTIIDSGGTAFADAVEGQFIGISGSADNDGAYRIITKTDDGEVVVAPAPTTEAAGATVAIKGKMARSDKNRQAYTIQKRTPSSTGYVYETFQGCQIGSMDLSLTAASLFTMSVSIMGLQKLDQTTELTGQTDKPTTSARIIGSVDGIPQIWIDNVPMASCPLKVTDATVNIDNGSSGVDALGCEGYSAIVHDRINVTGTFNTYADPDDPLAEVVKADNQTLFSLALETRDVNGNRLIVTRDSTMYTAMAQENSANGELVMNSGSVSSDGKNNAYLTTIQFDYIPA